MTGLILRNLLDSRQKLFVPGLGIFSAETRSSELQFGSGLLTPPSARIEFSRRVQDSCTVLRDHLASHYGMMPSRAEEMLEKFSADVWKGLSESGRARMDGFGSLAYDAEGNLQFLPLEGVNYALSSFGLRPLKAESLALRNRIPAGEHEAPVIPLRPFDSTEDKGSSFASYRSWAAVIAGFALAAGSVFWFSGINDGNHNSTGQASMIPVVSVQPKAAASPSQVPPAASESAAMPAAEALRFYVVAGSFKSADVAAEAEKVWKGKGFSTSVHPLQEKEMKRISIGSFGSKEEALAFMSAAQPEFDSSLWILKEAEVR